MSIYCFVTDLYPGHNGPMEAMTDDTYLTEISDSEAEDLAQVMGGLASPVRLKILAYLRGGPQTVTSICDSIDENQTTVSNHLRLLRHLNLVMGERSGRNIYYSLYDTHVTDLLDEAIRHSRHTS